MKKSSIYLMLLAMMAVTLVGCGKDEELAMPIIKMPSKIIYDVYNLDNFKFNVTITSANEDLDSVKSYVLLFNETHEFPIMTMTATDFGITPKKYAATFTAAHFGLVQAKFLKFRVEAYTKSTKSSKTALVEIVGEVEL